MQKQQVCVYTTVCLLSGGFHPEAQTTEKAPMCSPASLKQPLLLSASYKLLLHI